MIVNTNRGGLPGSRFATGEGETGLQGLGAFTPQDRQSMLEIGWSQGVYMTAQMLKFFEDLKTRSGWNDAQKGYIDQQIAFTKDRQAYQQRMLQFTGYPGGGYSPAMLEAGEQLIKEDAHLFNGPRPLSGEIEYNKQSALNILGAWVNPEVVKQFNDTNAAYAAEQAKIAADAAKAVADGKLYVLPGGNYTIPDQFLHVPDAQAALDKLKGSGAPLPTITNPAAAAGNINSGQLGTGSGAGKLASGTVSTTAGGNSLQQTLQGVVDKSGVSGSTWLMLGAAGVGLYLVMGKGKK